MAVTCYLLMLGVGLILALGGRYLDRSVMQSEPELAEIQPTIPMICFGAQVAGMMISIAALGSMICALF